MDNKNTRDLVIELIGEWKEFRKTYDRNNATLKKMIGKVEENSQSISRLTGWKNAHEKHHTLTYRLVGVIVGVAGLILAILRITGR